MGSEKSPPSTDVMAYREGGQERTAANLLKDVRLLIQKARGDDWDKRNWDELIKLVDKGIKAAENVGVEEELVQKLKKLREIVFAISEGRLEIARAVEMVKLIHSINKFSDPV